MYDLARDVVTYSHSAPYSCPETPFNLQMYSKQIPEYMKSKFYENLLNVSLKVSLMKGFKKNANLNNL